MKKTSEKVMEVISWMTKTGYDRKASQQIAPIIVQYIEQHTTNTPVIK